MTSVYTRYVFPWLVELAMSSENFSEHRRALLEGLEGLEGQILEVGFGTGLNLPHYPTSVGAIVAIDSNPGMRARARRRIERTRIPLHCQTLDGQHLPMPDMSFDAAVSTWTLCSIPEVEKALSEIRRVLKPGGRFLFLEHGRSSEPGIRKWQRRLTPIQRLLADGCHLDRNIDSLIRRAGFRIAGLETFYMRNVPRIGGYMYKGIGVKAD